MQSLPQALPGFSVGGASSLNPGVASCIGELCHHPSVSVFLASCCLAVTPPSSSLASSSIPSAQASKPAGGGGGDISVTALCHRGHEVGVSSSGESLGELAETSAVPVYLPSCRWLEDAVGRGSGEKLCHCQGQAEHSKLLSSSAAPQGCHWAAVIMQFCHVCM